MKVHGLTNEIARAAAHTEAPAFVVDLESRPLENTYLFA